MTQVDDYFLMVFAGSTKEMGFPEDVMVLKRPVDEFVWEVSPGTLCAV